MATFHPCNGPFVSEPLAVDGLEDLEVAIAAHPPLEPGDALVVQETVDGTSWVAHPVPGTGAGLLSARLPSNAARTHVRLHLSTGGRPPGPVRIRFRILPPSPKDPFPPPGEAS